MRSRLELVVAVGISSWIFASCDNGDAEEGTSSSSSHGTGSTNATSATEPDTSEATSSTGGGGSSDTTPVDVDYETDIQPIFNANCIYGCHEESGIEGAGTVRLSEGESYATLTTRKPLYSTRETFVVAGSAADSFLIDALRHPPGTIVRRMPLLLDESGEAPHGVAGTALPEQTILLIEAWIDVGANP